MELLSALLVFSLTTAVMGKVECPVSECAPLKEDICAQYTGSTLRINTNNCSPGQTCSMASLLQWSRTAQPNAEYSCSFQPALLPNITLQAPTVCLEVDSNREFKVGVGRVSCMSDADCVLQDGTVTPDSCLCTLQQNGLGVCKPDMQNPIFSGYWDDCDSKNLEDLEYMNFWAFYLSMWPYLQTDLPCSNYLAEVDTFTTLFILYNQAGLWAMGGLGLYLLMGEKDQAHCWVYRDDIGQRRGIKGYEEQAMIDKFEWPFDRYFGSHSALTLRRGFKVFTRSCNNCHAMSLNKYDYLIKKAFRQNELGSLVGELAPVSPGHWRLKGFFRQEWDERPKRISDYMFSPYLSHDHARSANGGLLPSDLSRIGVSRPGSAAYVYNILTGYHYEPPYGIDVPEGKFFNPYFNHMIIGMPRPLYDGMMEYDDGTPASTPQMSYDVSEFIHFMSSKDNLEYRVSWLKLYLICLTVYPFMYWRYRSARASMWHLRVELYNVSDGYKKYKYFMRFYKVKRAFGWKRFHPRAYFIGK